jgi:hypothetical protein
MREIGRLVQGQFFKFFSTSGLHGSWGKRIFWRRVGGTILPCGEFFFDTPLRHSLIGGGCRARGTEFFGARPKKVPPVFPPPAPHPDAIELVAGQALFCKWRGEKDLERQPRRVISSRPRSARWRRPTFFASTQKKSPFFSAPKKPKKSVGEWRARWLRPSTTRKSRLRRGALGPCSLRGPAR